MRYCVVILLFLLASCNKPDPNPELKDPIYQDLLKRVKEMEGQIAEETKTLEEHKGALAKVVPQTGQNKYAQKRVFDSENKLEHLKQLKKYLEIATESRKAKDALDYTRSMNKGEPWPDPAEFKDYLDRRKGDAIPRAWSYKARMEEFKQQNPTAKPGGGGH